MIKIEKGICNIEHEGWEYIIIKSILSESDYFATFKDVIDKHGHNITNVYSIDMPYTNAEHISAYAKLSQSINEYHLNRKAI